MEHCIAYFYMLSHCTGYFYMPNYHNNSLREIFSLHFTEQETEVQNKVKKLSQGYTKTKWQNENSNFGVSDSKICAFPTILLCFSQRDHTIYTRVN